MRRRNRRRGSEELNLTPLLDVLFSILFLVMLCGASINQQTIDEAAEESRQLQETIGDLNAQIDAFNEYVYSAAIISIYNVKDENEYSLHISQNGEVETVLLLKNADNALTALNKFMEGVIEVKATKENEPVYIVFSVDERKIYNKDLEKIKTALNTVTSNNENVYLKILSVEG